MVVRQLHRHRLLVEGVQLLVIRFGEPLTGGLPADQVAGLKPAQEPAIVDGLKSSEKIKSQANLHYGNKEED